MSEPVAALRTPQIDAAYLDGEFQSYNWDMFSSLFRSSHVIHTFKHELQLFLRLLTSSQTLLSSRHFATLGQQLLQIKYSPSPLTRWQKYVHLLSLVLSYAYNKFILDHRRLLPLQFIYRSLVIVNFLVFLHGGQYLRLAERIVRLRTVHQHAPSLRILEYSQAKRELIWHTLNETLGTLIPFVTSLQARTFLRRHLHGTIMRPLEQSHQLCSVCDQCIVMPHESTGDCRHYFCYACAYSLIQQSCPICFKTIHGIRAKEFSPK